MPTGEYSFVGQDFLWNLLDGNTLGRPEPVIPCAISAAYDMGRVLHSLPLWDRISP